MLSPWCDFCKFFVSRLDNCPLFPRCEKYQFATVVVFHESFLVRVFAVLFFCAKTQFDVPVLCLKKNRVWNIPDSFLYFLEKICKTTVITHEYYASYKSSISLSFSTVVSPIMGEKICCLTQKQFM